LRRKSFELENENRRALEASRLKTEFLANMSHELRTPLNAIVGFARLMHAGRVGPVSVTHKEYLGDIVNSAVHLQQIIDDVLDLVKVETGRTDLNPESFDLAELIAEVESVCRGFASERDLRIERVVDPALGCVTLDRRLLRQILYNLISNAIKFTPDGGAVSVRAAVSDDSTLRLVVEDSGIGIKAEDMKRLFIEFQQLDTGAAKKYQGTGLGLALTKRLVELHGGEISVESQPGKGTCFSLSLPRHVAHSAPSPLMAAGHGGA
jgi:signal transduction histidine kinase